MPKLKTRKGVVKRFKVTAGGKIKRRRAFGRHLMTDKTSKRKRHLRHGALVSKADQKRVRTMLLGS